MFWKKNEKLPIRTVGEYDFNFVMGRVEQMLKEFDNPQQKIAIVDYFVGAVKADIADKIMKNGSIGKSDYRQALLSELSKVKCKLENNS